MVWYGMVWYGMVWYGMVWYGMVWYGMVWRGIRMAWYTNGVVWCDVIMHSISHDHNLNV
jgi:chloride channel 2